MEELIVFLIVWLIASCIGFFFLTFWLAIGVGFLVALGVHGLIWFDIGSWID